MSRGLGDVYKRQLLFGFVGIVTVLRYKSYLNSTFDFGIFTQMYENMRQTGSVATTL